MGTPRGPVVVGMDASTGSASIATAVDRAAREAIERRVDLRLVYGRESLPSWSYAWQILADELARAAGTYPTLAVTAAVYPGTAQHALAAASDTASAVVLAARTADAATVVVLTDEPECGAGSLDYQRIHEHLSSNAR